MNIMSQLHPVPLSLRYRVFWNTCFAIALLVGIWAYGYELKLPALGFHWTSVGIVYGVVPGSAAEQAGVRVGDTFWLDGVRVEDTQAFNQTIDRLRVGQVVEVEVERGPDVVALPLVPRPNSVLLEGWLVDYLVGLVCLLSGWLVFRSIPASATLHTYQALMLDMSILFFTLRPSPAHFRIIEYLCFGLAPGLFLWFFMTLAGQSRRKRWWWTLGGGLPGFLAGLGNTVLVFWPAKPDFNWPYMVLACSLIWGMVAWLIWLAVELGAGKRDTKKLLAESAIKVIILTLPWFASLIYIVSTTWRLGMTMLFHFSTIGFPLALTTVLLEQHRAAWVERITQEVAVQIPLHLITQTLYWAIILTSSSTLHIAFTWDNLLLGSLTVLALTLLTPWLYLYLKTRLGACPGKPETKRLTDWGENRGTRE